ncbi:MAG TPA: hypothetical protein VGJ21_16950 [Terracidiphilus sp.]|jgi:hypothetical protein
MKFNGVLSLFLVLPGILAVSALTRATTVTGIQKGGTWHATHDAGTPGASSGWSGIVSSPSMSGAARHLSTSYKNYGGERYEKSIADDIYANNFSYDAWVYIKDSASGVKNIEMDLNQVIANGWTVIMGFQCDSWSGTWDYTANKGTATKPDDKWIHSSVGCNTKNWAVNKWHHIQIAYYRDKDGYVTYQSVAFDGVTHKIGARVFSGFSLGWGKTILTNFQIDGGTTYASGSNVFLDELKVSYW